MEGGCNIQEEAILNSATTSQEVEPGSGFMFVCCHPKGTMHRFIALIFMCFLGFGSYFCYDNPGGLHDKFTKDDLNMTNTEFMMLYSVYSWPNVILCFVGGFLIDSVFGIALGTNIYMGLTLLGQLIFASGVFSNQYWMMLAGRFIFGIGAESLAVAQNNYAVLWFKGKELNMVFGLQLSFARVGSTASFWVVGSIYDWVHEKHQGAQALGIVLFIATLTCVFSMLCALILGLMDKRAERILRRNEIVSGETVRLSDVKNFGVSFWLLSAICVFYYVAIFPFIGLGQDFFKNKFHMSSKDANYISSLVYLISAFASPALGLMVDKMGRNLLWIFVSIYFTIMSHCLLAFTDSNPYVSMIIMGIAYSALASSLWPLVSLMIPENQLGTAYGVCQAVQNTGLAVFPIIVGQIRDQYGLVWMEVFFIASLGVALLASVGLWLINLLKNGLLNMTPSERVAYQQGLIAADVMEKEKLLREDCASSSSAEFLQPNSDFHIRNRYLSRIGAALPSNYNANMKAPTYRALR